MNVESDATISPCGHYRYTLDRRWAPGRCMPFVMLNPSTADASVDDPTIRRCMGFARREGFAGIRVSNLYAYRATKPAALCTAPHSDPEGPDNLDWIEDMARGWQDGEIVCAWGASPYADPRHVAGVVNMLQRYGAKLVCLGKTANGSPRHPLYVRGDQPLERFP